MYIVKLSLYTFYEDSLVLEDTFWKDAIIKFSPKSAAFESNKKFIEVVVEVSLRVSCSLFSLGEMILTEKRDWKCRHPKQTYFSWMNPFLFKIWGSTGGVRQYIIDAKIENWNLFKSSECFIDF